MSVQDVCRAARQAARVLAGLPRERKDGALEAIAEALERRAAEIQRENDEDVRLARASRLPHALIDRLLLDDDRVRDMVATVRDVAALPDPVGQVVEGWKLANGIDLRRVHVPLGVVAVVYEARPNVTVDAAALCLKTGNAVVLHGGSAAKHSTRILAEVVQGAVIEAGLPREAIAFLGPDRVELDELVCQRDSVDLLVPRGGVELRRYVLERAEVPVIWAAGGNCHLYVDAAADLDKAARIALNAKVQRPGVCNAVETLLVHRDAAATFLPDVAAELHRRGVELYTDKVAAQALGGVPSKRASRTHYETEFLDLRLAVRVVDSLDEALDHIAAYGTGHSEAIVTEDATAARRFVREVDAACVYVNASTRFTDGAQFGLGAELGISTRKLHARGPIALAELTSVKYELWGDGQVRG